MGDHQLCDPLAPDIHCRVFLPDNIFCYGVRFAIRKETTMIFKEAVSAYTAVAKGRKGASDAKPSPSRSSQARGIWFLRDRQGGQIARVSKSGVRLAGSTEFAKLKRPAVRRRARA